MKPLHHPATFGRFFEIVRQSLDRKYLLYTFVTFLISLFCTGIEMIVPLIIGQIIDTLASANVFSQIVRPLVWLILLSLLQIPATYLLMRLTIRLKKNMAFAISQLLAERIKNARKEKLLAKGAAYLQQRVRDDVSMLIDSFFDYAVSILVKLISLVVISVLIYRISPAILMLFFAATPFYFVMVLLFKNPLYKFEALSREAYAEFIDAFAAQFERIPFIKLHAIYAETKALARRAFQKSLGAIDKEAQVQFFYSSSGWIVKVFAEIGLFYRASTEIIAKKMTIGQLTITMSYLSNFIEICQFLLSIGRVFQSARVSCDRINEVWELSQENPPGDTEIDELDRIDLCGLTYVTDDNRTLFAGLNYQFMRGRIYGIRGYNGSGKSTLLSLMCGLENGYTGGIYLNGIETHAIDMKKFRRNTLAAVEQHPFLYFEDLDTILSLGSGQRQINLSSVGWPAFGDWLASLRQQEHEHAVAWEKVLSGGEKQKIAIARAMMKKSSLWLFDEPTSALDGQSSQAFVEMLKQNKHEKIIILVTHDPTLLAAVDEVLHLK